MNKSYSVSYKDLLTILLLREKESKTLLAYAIETKTINPETIINILNHQNENHKTFYESFRAILGDNFTDKYLKLYAAQQATILSLYEERSYMLSKAASPDSKSAKLAPFSLELLSNSSLKIVSITANESKSTMTLATDISESNLKNREASPAKSNTTNYKPNYDEDDSEDDDGISAYEAPELVVRTAEQYPFTKTTDNDLQPLQREAMKELDASESSSSLTELTEAEKLSSGFVIPTFYNEPIDESCLSDFLEFFDDYQRTNIETLIMSAKTKTDKELTYVFNSMYREFHSLKGSSRFCKLKVFEMITHYIEDLISDVQQKITSIDKATEDQFEETLLLGMDLLWELKLVIEEYKNEKPITDNTKWINKAHHLWLAIEKTRFNLRFSAA